MATKKKMLQAAAGAAGGEFLAIEDVFSTYLYTGNGSTQTITNGIDLAGQGGLVWAKARSTTDGHFLFDTERGPTKRLRTHATDAETVDSTSLTSFNADGFSIGANASMNGSGTTYASWTFRKAPRFFDVVTYTGDGNEPSAWINHNLGVLPGCIVIKRTDSTSDWFVYHRSLSNRYGNLLLNSTTSELGSFVFDDSPNGITDTQFRVFFGANNLANITGATYVAYLFAHDPLGPSGDGSDGLIACGSYTGTGAAGNFVDLGWEPQWLLVKPASLVDNWWIVDTMRGLPTGGNDLILNPNASSAEINAIGIANVDARGFYPEYPNSSGQTYIYIAIRRGPMRQPTSGTEVFAIDQGDGSSVPAFNAGFPVDFALLRRPATSEDNRVAARLTGNGFMATNLTSAEDTSNTNYKFDYPEGFFAAALSSDYYSWMFRRAPGFFDVVAYTGDGVAGRTVPHNLGVAPEMMWVKSRTDANSWYVYTQPTGNNGLLTLNTTNGVIAPVSSWDNTSPTDAVFSVDSSNSLNGSGITYIAYLFATLPGVSKIGTFTHTSGTQTDVDCGFTAGARFVLIKRTDGISNWWVFDTARGIVVGNDPLLSLSDTHAEETIYDVVDPLAAGFSMDSGWGSGTYLFYAIA